MSCRIRLILALHNHQPIGNFEGVFEDAYADSYAAFLDVLEEYPDIPIALHTSGSLLEWIVEAHPEYVGRLRKLVERGQVEIIGGAFYEPILSSIPRRDRTGQVTAFSGYLQRLFGVRVRGMWVPERVWEQAFASDIAAAGIEYTILDDYHFRAAGLGDDDLHGYYLTEDEGRLLKVFPGSERLRYTIPFADPQETIDYLGSIAERCPGSVVTFGDDGEKFGTWPETKKHVYADGWLRWFFDTLRQHMHWIKITTPSEAVDYVAPRGTCYLPDCSYREMTEWALPTERQIEYHDLVERKKHEPDWQQVKSFLKGGFWRNFRVRYPEANEMYARMLQVSRRLEELEPSHAQEHGRSSVAAKASRGRKRQPTGVHREADASGSPTPEADASGSSRNEHEHVLAEARTALYKAQCNCSYWHGAFGGLYLPHLRNAVYEHLIAADSLLESAAGRNGRWVEVEADDYNLDARKEVRLAGDRLVAYLAPGRGGHLYELDVRGPRINLLATLNRRPEPYHRKVLETAQKMDGQDGKVSSIHDLVRFKQPELDKKLAYDDWPRKSLVDHFLQPGLSLDAYQTGGGEMGDFVTGVYETTLRRSEERVEACMAREGEVGPYRVRLSKTIALEAGSGSQLEVLYELEDLPRDVPLHFGVEFNFAGMAAGADDRYYYDSGGRQLGRLESVHSLPPGERLGLMDEWLGLDAALEFSQPAEIWTFPIQTISQSEGGFELVHQSCAVVPHWEFTAPADGRWSVRIVLAIDTSAAQARRLREAAVTG